MSILGKREVDWDALAQSLKDAELKPGTRVPIEGQVYCVEHTCVHEDSTDPYGYGAPDCKRSDHRKIAWYAKKGDLI